MTNPSRVAANMTQLALWVVGVLLSVRVVLRLLNADATNRFVQWVYDSSQPAVHPFFNWFPQVRTGDGFVVEFATLFALAAYAVVGFVFLAVVANYRSKVNTVAGGKPRFNISFNR